jgi:hypothetical protein
MTTKAKPKAKALTQHDREALIAAVKDYAKGNYPARDVVLVACRKCRGELFEVQTDDSNGCALRCCVSCKTERMYLDSAEYWDEADPEQAFCTCEGATFHTAVGYARTKDGKDVKWVYIGLRCIACGLAGVYADWKIDYSPSLGLLDQA